MRIFSVAQFHSVHEENSFCRSSAEVFCDDSIVRGCAKKHFRRQFTPEFCRCVSLTFQFLEYAIVIQGIAYGRDICVILRSTAKEGLTTDIHLFNCLLAGYGSLRDRFFEGVQIDRHKIDRFDAVLLRFLQIFGMIASQEDAAGDLRMHGFDASAEHLRNSCNFFHGDR